MKKLSLVVISLLLVLNAAYAQKDMPKESPVGNCAFISPNFGSPGSRYETSDHTQTASLWYNANDGMGVSGGFGALIDGKNVNAPLTNSTCYNGGVNLNWNVPGFSGTL